MIPLRPLAPILLSVAVLAACGGADQVDTQSRTDLPSAVVGAQAAAAGSAPVATLAAAGGPVYRFAKISNGAYFYTGNAAEKDEIQRSYPDFRYEGVAFLSNGNAQEVPVYRFANLRNGGYFFTASEWERDNTIANYPHLRPEGSTFGVARADDPGAVPVYRLASLTGNGAYLYTASRPEYDAAIAMGTWRGEGIVFHAWPATSQPSEPATYESSQRLAIPDDSTAGIASTLQVARTGASGTVTVRVVVQHTYIGDLVIELAHPDGTVFTLQSRVGGGSDNLDQTYTVDAGSRPSQGTWTLRVRDVSRLDSGTLTGWRLSFPAEPSPGTDPGTTPVPMPAEGWTLSGTVSLPPTGAIDSDTNDPNQTGRRNNDDFPVAQALRLPTLLAGSVNLPGEGPTGATWAAGDEIDVFRTSLKAGQVVELEFSADPDAHDLDLYIFNSQGNVVGDSTGVNRYECIRATRDGDYYVAVHAYEGASIYNLRIGSPGESQSCANGTASSTSLVEGELVALLRQTDTGSLREHRQALERARVEVAQAAPTAAPQLLRLPASARERAQGLGRTSAAGAGRTASLQLTLDTVAQAKRLARTGLYHYVEPNRRVYLQALTGTFPPDDRYYVAQRWHYDLISLPSAMSRIASLPSMPTRRPVVAVIDSGIVDNHPDLAPQIVDGYSFISSSREGDGNTPSPNDPSTAGDRPVFHGTHVAGTIGAVTFNGEAGAGVAPMAQLMPLRVFRPEAASTTLYDVAQAILYAAGLSNNSGQLPSRRADVINLSLGGHSACAAAWRDAIGRARGQGVIVVAASGNESRNDLGRTTAVANPANCPGVVSVGALDARARQTYYSNAGPELTVAAPGGDQSQATNGSGYPDTIYSTIGAFDAGGRRVSSFGPMDGTSMATPHVAGVMALMRFVNPAITPEQIDQLFVQGRLTDDIGSPGRDNATGHGLINARKAVDAALALQGGGGMPEPAGTVVASPAALDFGSLQTSAEIELRLTAASTEQVTSIVPASPAFTVSARQVDAKTRLGLYTVSVDRSRLGTGTTFTRLTVRTTARQFEVAVSVFKPASGSAGTQADYGPLYVLLIDPQTQETIDYAMATASNGTYRWSYRGLRTHTRVQILAGTDIDNDQYICQRGEPCGGYPVLSAELQVVDLSLRRTGLDFSIAPFGGINTSAVPPGGGVPGLAGRRR